jgi:hypothetical protein
MLSAVDKVFRCSRPKRSPSAKKATAMAMRVAGLILCVAGLGAVVVGAGIGSEVAATDIAVTGAFAFVVVFGLFAWESSRITA